MMSTVKNSIDRLFLMSLLFSFSMHILAISLLLMKGAPGDRHFYLPAYNVRIVGSIKGKHQIWSREETGSALEKKKAVRSHEEKGAEISHEAKKKNEEIISMAKRHKEEMELLKEINSVVARLKQKLSMGSGEVATSSRGGISELEKGQGLAKGEGVSKEKATYFDLLWLKIKNNWSIPPELNTKKNILECIVGIKIKKSGMIMNIWMEKSSGNRLFDESAMRAISKTAPFPPFSDEIKEDYIEIGVRFRGSDT